MKSIKIYTILSILAIGMLSLGYNINCASASETSCIQEECPFSSETDADNYTEETAISSQQEETYNIQLIEHESIKVRP